MTSRPLDFAARRISTADWPERDRLTILREEVGRTLAKFDIAPLSGGPFHCEVVMRALPGLGIVSGVNANMRAAKTRELLDDRDNLVLMMNMSGLRIASQRDEEVTLEPGEAVLMSTAEVGVAAAPSVSRFINLRLSRRALAPLVSAPEDALMRPLRRNTEALRLLTRYIAELDGDYLLATPDLQRAVVTHVHDLVALAIGATGDAAAFAKGRGLQAARLTAVKADIRENLSDGELALTAVALRQGLTPRQIQRLFEREGVSFSEFVLGERLAHAYRLLADPRSYRHTISAIAFEVGFNDLSYFNRTFRRRYGLTPSDVRRASLS